MIKKLSTKLIQKIAAGEVISRPHNAVKEIIENSIDAQATQIKLLFEEYGMKSIIIIDNGIGMSKEDLLLATQMHTTSKTEEDDDFFGNKSFGFRGEALASIQVIADLIIESNGYKLHNNVISESLVMQGTKITIKNLFKPVPARLKFIKNEKHEFQLIKELIKKFLIQHHHINWQIFHNQKALFQYSVETKEQRINKLFKEVALKEYTKTANIQMITYILKNKRNLQILYVNQRPVKDRAIFNYINSLFKEYTFIHGTPGYILDIQINPMLVDFNVHPAKEEIKFMNYQKIFSLIQDLFSMHNLAPKLNNTNIIFETHLTERINEYQQNQQNEKTINQTERKALNSTSFIPSQIFEQPPTNTGFKTNQTLKKDDDLEYFLTQSDLTQNCDESLKNTFKIIGQLQNAYILFENENGLGIFDQHAAHERHLYEQLKKQLNKNSAQLLLTPILLQLQEEQKYFLEEQSKNLENKGIFLENNTILALPSTFKDINPLKETLENLDFTIDINTTIERLLANIACKNALKANTPLSVEQMQTLLQNALVNPPICNHGRPVFKYFSNNEIKNFFKRT